ncbi:hypothetical protein ACTJK4_24985 [Ralstonia sp. 22111]|uniref:hypothetical protein n=1 Tax=Ralstonia sp. 22111 TaxID=3453878 RepID=UPI003F87C20D
MVEIISAAIVMIARQPINVPALNQLWLAEHGVVTKEEVGPQSVQLPMMVKIDGPFDLLIVGDRVQFFSAEQGNLNVLSERAKRLLDAAGISIKTIGISIVFSLYDEHRSLIEVMRGALLANNPLAGDFTSEGAVAGLFLRRPVELGGHYQIEVRPGRMVREASGGRDVLIWNANQEFEVADADAAHKVLDLVGNIQASMSEDIHKFLPFFGG